MKRKILITGSLAVTLFLSNPSLIRSNAVNNPAHFRANREIVLNASVIDYGISATDSLRDSNQADIKEILTDQGFSPSQVQTIFKSSPSKN